MSKKNDGSGSFYDFCKCVQDVTDENSHTEKQKIIQGYTKDYEYFFFLNILKRGFIFICKYYINHSLNYYFQVLQSENSILKIRNLLKYFLISLVKMKTKC
jgi:hypothetical protein